MLTPTYNKKSRSDENPQKASVAKSMDPDNMMGMEAGAMGLDMIFGGAVGVFSFDLLYDAVEVYDEIMQDRFDSKRHNIKPAPQPDPRIWIQPQPGMPCPGMNMAA